MKQEIITVANVERRAVMPDSYTVEIDHKKPTWRQRFVRWVLTKFFDASHSIEETIEQIVIDPENLMENFFAQYDSAQVLFHDYRLRNLYIGPEEFKKLARAANVPGSFSYEFMTGYHQRGGFHNMKVTIVPWMKGVLLTP